MNFKNYMYCNKNHLDTRPSCKVYHDKKRKHAVFTDGRFMILSRELYDESKDVEYLKKIKNCTFDFKQFNYMKVVYPKEDLEQVDFDLFKSEIYLAEEKVFDSELPYDDALYNKVFFKDFGICLTAPIIHVVNQFINDNLHREMKVWLNKEDVTRNILIEAYNDSLLDDGVLNSMYFMPVASNTDYQVTVENNELKDEPGTYLKDIEKLYSWSEMANDLTDRGIPHSVVATLADTMSASIYNRPIFDIFKFDDYLHEKYGDYESKGKSLKDMFEELFGDDADKIAYYFGIEENTAKERYYDNINKVGE